MRETGAVDREPKTTGVTCVKVTKLSRMSENEQGESEMCESEQRKEKESAGRKVPLCRVPCAACAEADTPDFAREHTLCKRPPRPASSRGSRRRTHAL